jgi:PAS domain S-box-containing protein
MTVTEPLTDRLARFALYARIVAAFVALSAALVLAGWALDVPVLKSPLPPATMKANTAICFVLLAAALWWSAAKTFAGGVRALAAATVLLAAATVSQDVAGWTLGIDELLIADRSGRGIPGRMSPITASCFIALAIALMLCRRDRTTWLGHGIAASVAFVSAVICLGYIYGVRALHGPTPDTLIATHTALLLLALAIGVLFAHPSGGLMRPIASDSLGGSMARRLLPVAVIAPVVVGGLWLWGARTNLYGVEVGTSIVVVAMIVILSAVIWWNAGDLLRTESERRQAQDALRLREAQTASILDTSLHAVISIDRQGLITYWNRPAEVMFGWSRTEAIGRELASLIMPARLAPLHRSGLQHFLETGDGPILGRRVETTGLRRDGTELPVELSVVALSVDGAPAFNAFLADISDRKGAEQAQRVREQHKSALLRLAKALGQTDQLSDVMEAALREIGPIMGYRNLWAYLFADDGKTAVLIQAHGEVAEKARAEFPVLPVEGDRYLEELRDAHETVVVEDARTDPRTNKAIVELIGNRTIVNTPMLLADRKIGIVGTGSMGADGVCVPSRLQLDFFEAMVSHVAVAFDRIRLLGDRARAMEETRALNAELNARVVERTLQLQAANKELEAFSYSVSHDLRAPLRHIDGFSKILMDDYSDSLDPRAQRYLGLIRGGAHTMGRMIDDLLQMARVDRRDLSRQPTDLNAVVAEVLDELRSDVADRAIEWSIEPLPIVSCDPGLIKLVFGNLLSNAVKYTRSREPAIIRVAQEPGSGPPVIVVQDNGAGFDPRYADKLFGVFQRLHRADEFEGTGIGLATVQRIIQKHGGRVWADAAVDRGATFSFTLAGPASADDTHREA